MTTEVQEDNANPYNQKKSWHDGVEESFEDATGMYFEKPKAKAKQPEQEVVLDWKFIDLGRRFNHPRNQQVVKAILK